jgi:hypothetical protein
MMGNARGGLGRWCLLVAFGAALAASPVRAGDPRENPEEGKKKPPAVKAVRAEQPPVIDGKMDDACWEQAVRLEGFSVLDVDLAVPEETVGFVCVDDKAVYVGLICKDRTPEDIKSVETRRNGEIWGDDWVEFDIDCCHDHEQSYAFLVTANGTQWEWVPGGSAAKIEWRGDWTAAVARTPEGWAAEMAIPFPILRYPAGQETFGVSIWRHHAKESLLSVYPGMGKTWNPNLAADMVGMHPPYIPPRPIIMPYVTADFGDFVGRRFDTGVDVQYRLPNGLMSLATLNPDFKQIEDVVEPISFSYTERYLEERRPFFITGQSGYFPREHLFYTRRIEDFDAGVKLFGTVGNETIGVLNAVRFGAENSLAAQWQHKMDQDFATKLLLVSHRQAGEPNNLCYGLDMAWTNRVSDGGDTTWMVLYQSQTQGAKPGGSYAVGGSRWRGSGKLGNSWMIRTVSADFDPVLGYYNDQNSIGGNMEMSMWTRHEKGGLENSGWHIGVDYFPYLDGSGTFRSGVGGHHHWDWRNGRGAGFYVGRGVDYDEDTSDASVWLNWNNKDLYRAGGVSYNRGLREGCDYTYLSLNQGFRPGNHLSVKLSGEYSHLLPPAEDAGHEYQMVMTASYDLTNEKCIAARGIWRDEGFSAYASYRQVVRRGMDAYVIVGDPDPDRTGFASRVAVKLMWVL